MNKFGGLLSIWALLLLASSCKQSRIDIPDYRAKEFLGDSINLRSALKDKVGIVNTWFIGCTPCMLEMPFLAEVESKYKERQDFLLLTIAANTERELKQFIDTSLDSTNIFRAFALRFQINRLELPVLQGIDKEHRVIRAMRGGREMEVGLAHADTARMNLLIKSFKSNQFPTTILYNKRGEEVYRTNGFRMNYREEYLEVLMHKIDSLLRL